MSNGSESMSPEEFAKLMGAYPEPAHNPLPAYGGYMDNSPANFAWVNNNDYFGADDETFEAFQGNPEFEEKNYYGAEKKNCGCGQDPCITYGADTDLTPTNHMNNSIGQVVPITNPMELPTNLIETEAGGGPEGQITPDTFEAGTYLDVEPDDMDMLALNGRWWSNDGITEADLKAAGLTTKDDLKGTLEYMEMKEEMWGDSANDVATVMANKVMKGWGAEETFEASMGDHSDLNAMIQDPALQKAYKKVNTDLLDDFKHLQRLVEEKDTIIEDYEQHMEENAEVKEAPYGGAGALMDIGKETPLADFTGKELAESSAIHGDFDQASLNYSGHQNLEVRAEDYEGPMTYAGAKDYVNALESKIDGGMKDEGFFPAEYEDFKEVVVEEIENHTEYSPWHEQGIPTHHDYQNAEDEMNAEYYDGHDETDNAIGTSGRNVSGNFTYVQHTHIKKYKDSPYEDYREHHNECSFEMPIEEFLKRNKKYITIERDIYDAKDAEMEQLTMTVADVSNRFDESLGQIEVDDIDGDIDDIENVVLRIKDPMGDVVDEVTIDSDRMPDDWDDYLAESKTPSLLTLGIGAVAVILGWDVLKGGVNKVFNNETQEMLENDPELVESPDTGDLDPAAYEELVVESTGYALDIIPQGLDGSFMGSRFAALPTERYVDYNDPGIGAHTDMAIHRDEIFLEPEMAMVQAAEDGTVVKEAQAPGQSPYNSTTGEENPDFNYRVIKETHPISLDPAVKPFIPQSMAGYTGNANTPPSVMNKMFNIGVLGQTPAFVAGEGDMGANHFGSRDAIPNTLGLGGSVGGPLSDQVNANYTDGTTSMSLAQWAIENTVSQTSDTEAVVIDRSSGAMKRVRRV